MKNATSTNSTKAPQPTVKYPTADELRAFGKRCEALGESAKTTKGFMGVAAVRAAIDLDYLARLVDADPVKHVGQWTVVIHASKPKKARKKK